MCPRWRFAAVVGAVAMVLGVCAFPAQAQGRPRPVVVTGSATAITDSTMVLNGTVNPKKRPTTARFEWGTTTSYGNSTPDTSTGSGNGPVPVSAALTGLAPDTEYHFRLRATSPAGTTFGADMITRTRVLASSEMLSNVGFEGSYSGIAPSWSQTNWGSASATYSRTTTNPHGGTSAQQIAATGTLGDHNTDGLIYWQQFTALPGVTYQASVWLRADAPTYLQFGIRREDPFQEFVGISSVLVTTSWQQVTVVGGFEDVVDALFAIDFLQAGTVYVDDASLIMLPPNHSVASGAVIPDRLFGMHINNSLAIWSTTSEFELSRLWDTGTRWRDLETSNGTWDWSQLDTYVSKAVAAGQESLYTMGITPAWANGGDQTQPPTNLADWTDYVQQVGNRYDGEILYWEVWNEVDTGNFWTGTKAEMLALAEIAYDELKAINPANQILTPNITSNGLAWLDQYLYEGGDQFADIISFHRGFESVTPELQEPIFRGLRDLMAHHGQTSKPVFDTEVASLLLGTSEQQVGHVSRVWMLMWLWGFSNANWYAWDIYDDGGLVDYIRLSEESDKTTLTTAGVAWRETGRWLKGAQMTGKSVDLSGSWTITLTRAGGYVGHVVWNPNGSHLFNIPAEWGVTRKRDLAGNTTGQGAGETTIGYGPLLFENQAP
jgi:hypothetical protein